MEKHAANTIKNVREGTRCIGCGYELAGLPETEGGVCPECGLSLDASLSNLVVHSEMPDSIRRIARSIRVLQYSAYCLTGTKVLLIVMLIWFVAAIFDANWPYVPSYVEQVLIFMAMATLIACAVSLIMLVIGMFMISAAPVGRAWTVKKWSEYTRAGSIALPVGVVIWFVTVMNASSSPFSPFEGYSWPMYIGFVFAYSALASVAVLGKLAMQAFIKDLDRRVSGIRVFDRQPRFNSLKVQTRVILVFGFLLFMNLIGLFTITILIYVTLLRGKGRGLSQLRHRLLEDLRVAESSSTDPATIPSP